MGKSKIILSRRQFLKAATVTGVLIGGGGAAAMTQKAYAEGELGSPNLKTVRTTCSPNCTGACGDECHSGK